MAAVSRSKDQPADKATAPSGGLGETIQLVKEYARQETVGPLKGAGRWVGRGVAGAMCFAVATVFAVLGVLRLLQTETTAFHGRWMSVIPYLVATVVALAVVGIAIWRISKPTLQKEKRP